jgi:hypothetical protein
MNRLTRPNAQPTAHPHRAKDGYVKKKGGANFFCKVVNGKPWFVPCFSVHTNAQPPAHIHRASGGYAKINGESLFSVR